MHGAHLTKRMGHTQHNVTRSVWTR